MSKDDIRFFQRLGDCIRDRRHAKGLTQLQLAGRCDLHRTFIGSVERGERNLSLINLRRIAQTLKVTPSQLLEE